jgi:hypothetical protein
MTRQPRWWILAVIAAIPALTSAIVAVTKQVSYPVER